jgi:CTP synthase
MMLEKSNLSTIVCKILHLQPNQIDMREWEEMLARIHARNKQVKIALCGKYVQLHDAYLSVAEALAHGGFETGAKVEIEWIDTETITEKNVATLLKDVDGVLIPGGFGNRGIEGKIVACKYARENNIPYLGICLGMQIAVIEYARSVLGYKDANSSEFYPEGQHSVIDLMPDQYGVKMGGTMRLGAYPCKVLGPRMKEAYGTDLIQERHRHRFEFNNDYRKEFESKGMKIAGTSPDGTLCEAVEIPANDFFVGVQFHPEFKSRPNNAHPLFREFIRHAVKYHEHKKS